MQDMFVWVDARWQDPMWLSPFRMRLCGWIPSQQAEKAITDGLFDKICNRETEIVELTPQARRLTDIDNEKGESSNNCAMLSNVLISKGFDQDWLQKPSADTVALLRSDQLFPATFRDHIMRHIAILRQTWGKT